MLKLIEADSQAALCQRFLDAMQEDFATEHAAIILFGDPRQDEEGCRIVSAESARIEIGPLLRASGAVCGPLRQEEMHYLFPGIENVGSAAVMPLSQGGDLGVIAVGSSDAQYYDAAMGTLFLSHIADVLVRLIPRLRASGS